VSASAKLGAEAVADRATPAAAVRADRNRAVHGRACVVRRGELVGARERLGGDRVRAGADARRVRGLGFPARGGEAAERV
jgi:hypothetical protein